MNSFEHELARASADWVREGLLDAAQREKILALHPAPPAGTSPWAGRFVAILAGIGCMMVAVGVILLVSSNWDHIGDWTKIGVLVTLLITGYCAGWWLKMSPGRYPRTGDAVLMLSGILFLSGIALVSQIFHLNARPATGVLVWTLGISVVPWITRSKGAMFLSLVAWLTWLGYEFAATGGPLELAVDRYNNYEVFIWWAIYGVLGMSLVFAGLALRGGSFREFSGIFATPGLLIVCACLYALGFYRHAFNWYYGADEVVVSNPLSLALAGALLATALLFALRRALADTVLLGPWLLAGLVPIAGVLLRIEFGDDGWLWSALAWMLLFALNIAMIRTGLREGRESWVNLAIFAIGVNILTRFLDLFGTMLEGGIFFVAAGAVVIAVGIVLEKQRRALVARVQH